MILLRWRSRNSSILGDPKGGGYPKGGARTYQTDWWRCQSAASLCFQPNPEQVWPSFSRLLGYETFRWTNEVGLSHAQAPCMLDATVHGARHLLHLEGHLCCHSLFPMVTKRQKRWGSSMAIPIE